MRPERAYLAIGAVAALVTSCGTPSRSQDSGPTAPGSLHASLRNGQPSFLVRAEVDHTSHEYQEGDALSVRVISEVDAYLYVLYQQADGKVFQIFPNRAQPKNRVKAKSWVAIPSGDELFRWKIVPPFGKEVIKVVAARTPINVLADSSLSKERFNPVQSAQLKGAEDELTKGSPTRWAECATEITTTARRPGVPTSGRRFGVFVGVSKYRYNDIIERASKGEEVLNLPGCDNDAMLMDGIFRAAGKLDGGLLLVNEKATRANIELAITQWLPSVSRPGDTVFIYHSSHGTQIPDDYGDEGKTDKQDEVLLTHDFADYRVLMASAHFATRDKVPIGDDVKRLISMSVDVAGPQPDAKDEHEKWADRVNDFLARKTGISDDLLGHWIQELDGRQVIVILDTCHSGGFASREKSLVDDGAKPAFRFMDRTVSRLKDIGQRDVALLASCASSESSLTASIDGKGFGLMTACLLVGIAQARGPVELKQAYEACANLMKKQFVSEDFKAVNAKRKVPIKPYEPVLYSDLVHAAFLIP